MSRKNLDSKFLIAERMIRSNLESVGGSSFKFRSLAKAASFSEPLGVADTCWLSPANNHAMYGS
jgi:hypothetical protein